MKSCPNCNKELSDDAKFCDHCGTHIFETLFCPNCGQKTSSEFAFCQNCGASIKEMPVPEQGTQKEVGPVPQTAGPIPQAVRPPENKKKGTKKFIVFAALAVALIAVLGGAVSLFFGGGKTNKGFGMYVKDAEIFFSDLKKGKDARQLTSRLLDMETEEAIEALNEDYTYVELPTYTYVSEDGKYVFFPDKFMNAGEISQFSSFEEGYTLYYKDVTKPNAEAVKIDSGVLDYTVNTSTSLVTYRKGANLDLYQYDMKKDDKEKVAGGVSAFEVSDDGKRIVFINENGDIYWKEAGKEKDKIVSDANLIEYKDDKFSTVYYMKDDFLYKQERGREKMKIASDVYKLLKIYDSGEIYYIKSEEEELPLSDYVIDDKKEADGDLAEPEKPTTPLWWNYDSTSEYEAAYEAYEDAYELYETAYGEFTEKRFRDSLREALAEEMIWHQNFSLCYFDGSKEEVITDALADTDYFYVYGGDAYTAAEKAAVIVYEAYNQSDISKMKLSEIEEVYDVRNMVEASWSSSSEKYIAVKNISTVIEQEKEAEYFRIDENGTLVYYLDEIPEGKDYGELYRIVIKDGVVGKPEVYDSDVSSALLHFVDESKSRLRYFKDYRDGAGELYIDKEKIDDDVYPYYFFHMDTGRIFYCTDWNDTRYCGTLKVYQNGKSQEISDDVYYFTVTRDGRVLYLYDYSSNYHRGELYEWNNGKKRKIDDDVTHIINEFERKYRGKSDVY